MRREVNPIMSKIALITGVTGQDGAYLSGASQRLHRAWSKASEYGTTYRKN